MKVVRDTIKVKLKVKRSELFEGRYMYFKKVSALLRDKENSGNMQFKALRNRFYNSDLCQKYNVKEICGLKCIDTLEPMRSKASLELEFTVGD